MRREPKRGLASEPRFHSFEEHQTVADEPGWAVRASFIEINYALMSFSAGRVIWYRPCAPYGGNEPGMLFEV